MAKAEAVLSGPGEPGRQALGMVNLSRPSSSGGHHFYKNTRGLSCRVSLGRGKLSEERGKLEKAKQPGRRLRALG